MRVLSLVVGAAGLSAVAATEYTYFLKQARVQEIRSALERVSNPESAEWGQFLTHTHVQELQAPLKEHVGARAPIHI